MSRALFSSEARTHRIELNWGKNPASFFTHAVEINHFDYIVLDDIRGGPAFSFRGPAIKLSDGKNPVLRNSGSSSE